VTAFQHTPYDGSHRPFSIGLAPLDLAEWIEPDDRLVRQLEEKERLFRERPDRVFAAEPGTEGAQQEVLDLLSVHLAERFPAIWRRTGEGMEIVPAGRTVALGDPQPLRAAARLVQEDLILMGRDERGWRLVAAALCFPSSWSLQEKFGGTLDQIHAPVPGYETQLGARMRRIFDNLRLEVPVWRVNWSIYPDDALHHPESKEKPRSWFGSVTDVEAASFVRVERQTLRRLPRHADHVLFTVRIHVDPVTAFRRHPEGVQLAAGLRQQLLALDADQLAYKGLTKHRDHLAAALAAIVEPA